MTKNIITADDFAKLLKIPRDNAVARLYRLNKNHKVVRLDSPYAKVVCRYKLLVSMDEILKTQKFRKPKINPLVDWKKFCSDPFRLTQKVTE